MEALSEKHKKKENRHQKRRTGGIRNDIFCFVLHEDKPWKEARQKVITARRPPCPYQTYQAEPENGCLNIRACTKSRNGRVGERPLPIVVSLPSSDASIEDIEKCMLSSMVTCYFCG